MKYNYKNLCGLCLLLQIFLSSMVGCSNSGYTSSENNNENISEQATSYVPKVYEATIHIIYEESTGLNYSDDATVYIDDVEIGGIENGGVETFYLDMEEGQHEIYLRRDTSIRKYKTNKIKFEISAYTTTHSITAKENSISGLKISKN